MKPIHIMISYGLYYIIDKTWIGADKRISGHYEWKLFFLLPNKLPCELLNLV